ncbi:MAG: hypothetical protein KJ601_03820 [Nanoarchaeota archaeon]|nr:hypothetical protein [Nanoarchaeota archaeon]MBU1704148.1 hypothetical protein [Nanoarchaeota archaeon]
MRSETENVKWMYLIGIVLLALSIFGISHISTEHWGITGAVVGTSVADISDDPNAYLIDQYKDATKDDAFAALLDAEQILYEMKQDNLSIHYINDSLIEARGYFEGNDYDVLLREIELIEDPIRRESAKDALITAERTVGTGVDYPRVMQIVEDIKWRRDKAYELQDRIRAYEILFSELSPSMNISTAVLILDNARIELDDERYVKSEDQLSLIDNELDKIRAESTFVRTIIRIGRDTIIAFFVDNYIAIIVFLLLVLIFFMVFFRRLQIYLLKKKIRDMVLEQDVLIKLIKTAQEDYYAHVKIPRKLYETKVFNYKKRAGEIKSQLPVLNRSLDKLKKLKRFV